LFRNSEGLENGTKRRAQKNHDELFPGHVSTLAVTDPELIDVFDNFAFDEVLSHGSLDARTRLMVQLASMIASQALCEYRVMIRPALIVGVTPVEIKEIVYQAVPYVGMAKVFDFLLVTNEVLKENGVAFPLSNPVGLPQPQRGVQCCRSSPVTGFWDRLDTAKFGICAAKVRRIRTNEQGVAILIP
jgi:alkylhydroperoxidase/carboxymuconolactone decarboxylase family protein YurZ